MDPDLIQYLKNSWRNINTSTIKFAQSVKINQWNEKPFAGRFTTFSWEFACLLRTRLCYLRAFRTGVLSFSTSAEILDKKEIMKMDKTTVVSQLQQLGREILNEITKLEDYKKVDYVNFLFQHERIHQGKLVLYHSQMGIKLPKSFKNTWGESNFSSKTL